MYVGKSNMEKPSSKVKPILFSFLLTYEMQMQMQMQIKRHSLCSFHGKNDQYGC